MVHRNVTLAYPEREEKWKVTGRCRNERPKDDQYGLTFYTAKCYTDNLVLNFQLNTSPTTFLCVIYVVFEFVGLLSPNIDWKEASKGMC